MNTLIDTTVSSWDAMTSHRRRSNPIMQANVGNVANEMGSSKEAQAAQAKVIKQEREAYGVMINGQTLSVAALVAAARYRVTPALDDSPEVRKRIEAAVETLAKRLESGESLYGINTGFGGSADSRTGNMRALQLALLQHQQIGLLPLPANFQTTTPSRPDSSLPLSTHMLSQPEAWVRGAMVVRLNSLMRGHSGVRFVVLERMQKLLKENITPMVPLRGTISASGDLSPLSYVAGTLAGQSGIQTWVDTKDGRRVPMAADQALKSKSIPKTVFEPKEALGILNGTAFSTATAALTIHDASMLCLLTQFTTAMAVEAARGTDGSFAAFIHQVCRPHAGQVECAATIQSMLEGSKLASHWREETHVHMSEDEGSLRQDRYPLRTAAQWIGPQIEELQHSWKTIEREMNSTTDNPLIEVHEDGVNSTIHHGGNFQAMAISNTMERTRLALAHFGKLTFQQMTELINPAMSRGLPANLAATDPSLNFMAKGIDIALAAATAELGYLANPVTSHVQSAEMGNQAVNSMALVSTRYTIEAVETLSHLMAWSLYLLCQALDLRALQLKLAIKLESEIEKSINKYFSTWIDAVNQKQLARQVFVRLNKRMDETSARDLHSRLTDAYMFAGGVLVHYFSSLPSGGGADPLRTIMAWRDYSANETWTLYRNMTQQFLDDPKGCHASPLLGKTSKLYEFIRRTLGVPMHGKENMLEFAGEEGKLTDTIGSYVSVIYHSLRNGDLYSVLIDTAKDVQASRTPVIESLLNRIQTPIAHL
ncbi:phenylalanine ammonia-lyase [Meira miltonrushii]|uniref:Phenylalanine ammonia-lyase n=1 Tax=Meira miltonrushii TaxID=1280837 RepID=A0A316V5P7_9BASI|nr:phenylalanine ammonia-lyase [Meira miltonrushii]PWN32792.1 phenylalanine ammonia-lyase [Meira miltonrushii]